MNFDIQIVSRYVATLGQLNAENTHTCSTEVMLNNKESYQYLLCHE